MDPGSSSPTHRSFPYPTPPSHHGLQGPVGFRPHLPPPPPPPHLEGEGTHKEDIRSGIRSIECVPETHGVAPALPSQTQEIRCQPPSDLGSKPKSWVRGEWVNKMAFVSQLQEQQGPFPPVVRGFVGAASEHPTCSIRQRQPTPTWRWTATLSPQGASFFLLPPPPRDLSPLTFCLLPRNMDKEGKGERGQ